MREEEKLARDVYNTFYAQWGARVFNNIATSESRHMASIKTLPDRCGLTDPVGVDIPGDFVNSDLRALGRGPQTLDRLAARCSLSRQMYVHAALGSPVKYASSGVRPARAL